MRSIWLVVKHDVGTTFRQRSFWILSFLMPVLLVGLNAFYAIQDANLGSGGTAEEQTSAASSALPAIGLVDPAGLTAKLPPGFPSDLFTRFPDEASARAALEAGELQQYVLLPADYVKTGEIRVYDRDFQLLASGRDMGVAFHSENEWMLPYLITYNLTGDEHLALALRNPTPGNLAEWHMIRPPTASQAEGQALARLVATVLPYLFYFLLLIGSSFLMRSVVQEKENRTAEVLLLSVSPRQLMVGKIMAGTAVLLVQLTIWVVGGVLALNQGTELLKVAQFHFPPGFLAWAILFLVLGYLLFASAMAASGAIAPTSREGNQMIWLLVIPLMPTLMFASLFAEQPNHPLVVALSLFPLSAPSAMVTRLALTQVPLWQLLLSLAGLAATAYLFVVLAARFFRADNLLSSESFSWRRLATGWRKQPG
jgi:ABC-2 type transport system permease protein